MNRGRTVYQASVGALRHGMTYPIPLTWGQWWRLGHQNTYADFQTYAQTIIPGLNTLFRATGPTGAQKNAITALVGALRQHTNANAVVPAAHQPPTAAMVTAVDNLLNGLVTEAGANMAAGGSQEKAQAKWSPLNLQVIKQLTDPPLILASANNVVGWQPAWATDPIPVDINDPVMIPEIRVLCAFVLCSDDVVGLVISDDENGTLPAVNTAVPAEPRYAATLVADARPGGQRRTIECQNVGTMRSWHLDIPQFLAGKRSAAVPGPRRTAYQTRNQQDFTADQGVAVPIAEIPGNLKDQGHPVPQGMTEFNVVFGTQGRLIFDYDAGDFYLSGHYQRYAVPSEVLTPADKANLPSDQTCFPYFKLTGLDAITLDWAGHLELGRLRYWENQRRARHRGTVGK